MTPNVKAEMHLNTFHQESSVMAFGNVTINNAIRFPVQLRTYTDAKSGDQRTFLSYPRRLVNGKWKNVVTPDEEMKKLIEKKVVEECKELLLNRLDGIDVLSVNQVKKVSNHGNVATVGMATIRVSGLTIDGITIKRGEKGLFINMPQYQLNQKFYDQVYGIDKSTQEEISKAVIDQYEEQYLGIQKMNAKKIYDEYFKDEKFNMNETAIQKADIKIFPKI